MILKNKSIAVIGGGWAGCAASVFAIAKGAQVTLFEARKHLGGRASSPITIDNYQLDWGYHIISNAYSCYQKLLKYLGANIEELTQPMPLILDYGDTLRYNLSSLTNFLLHSKGVGITHKIAFLIWLYQQRSRNWALTQRLTVAEWVEYLPKPVQNQLLIPLCIAAMNTLPQQACAQTFANVLHDVLMQTDPSATLRFAKQPLQQLLPQLVEAFMLNRGQRLYLERKVNTIKMNDSTSGFQIDGQGFDAVIMATQPQAAEKLLVNFARQYPTSVSSSFEKNLIAFQQLNYQAISTLYFKLPNAQMTNVMTALQSEQGNVSFVFDLSLIAGYKDMFACVTSCSRTQSIEHEVFSQNILNQLNQQHPYRGFDKKPMWSKLVHAKNATIDCNLERPYFDIQPFPQMLLAGDYTYMRYPCTLESAVRSADIAVEKLL